MSSEPPEQTGGASEPSLKPDFSYQENKLRKIANRRLLALLEDENAEVPAGQLMSFVAKVGFRVEAEKPESNQIKQQNIFAILPGLPEDRQRQIIDGFQRELDAAKKELPRGR